MKYSVNFEEIHQKGINKKSNGFTLIELLIVLAIIAICVSWAVPNYQAFTLKSQRTEAKVLLLTLQSELERFYFQKHEYPKGLSELKQYQKNTVTSDGQSYLVSLEHSDDCTADNCYQLVAEHQSGDKNETLRLFATGERQGPW